MSKPNLRERLAYSFDNSLARGPVVIIAYLALLSIALIVVLATVVWVTGVAPEGEGGDRPGFIGIAWMALMRTLDSGTMGGDTGSWGFLLAMLAVTFGGIFVISTFIGMLTTAIEAKMDALRKGRSRVLESRHTVILGWSPQVFSIISELVAANANQKRAAVVILGDRDKVEMEDEIRERIGDTGPPASSAAPAIRRTWTISPSSTCRVAQHHPAAAGRRRTPTRRPSRRCWRSPTARTGVRSRTTS